MGARILYTIQIFENGDSIVHQHQRSLNPMKDVVVSPDRDFRPASVRLNIQSTNGGRIRMHTPADPNHMKGSAMRRTAFIQRDRGPKGLMAMVGIAKEGKRNYR